MLGNQLAGIRSTSAQRAKQTLGTLNSQEFPAMYPTLHCKFPASKFQPLQITESRRSKTGCSTTPHNSTDTFDPNRRPYTTERLLFTQNTGCRFAVPIRRIVHSALKATERQSQRGPVHDEPLSTRQRHTLNVPARVPGAYSKPVSIH